MTLGASGGGAAVLLLVAGVAFLVYRRSRRSRRQASAATVEGADSAATPSQLVASTAPDGATVGYPGAKRSASTTAKANAAAKAARAPSQRYLLRSPSRATVFPDDDATGLVAADDPPHAAAAPTAGGAAVSSPASGNPEVATDPSANSPDVSVTSPDRGLQSPARSAFEPAPSADATTESHGAAPDASAAEQRQDNPAPSLATAAPATDAAAELAASERRRLPGQATTAPDPRASDALGVSALATTAPSARDASSVPRRAASIKLIRAAVTATSATAYVATPARSRTGPRVASGWSQRNLLEESRGSNGGAATARGDDGKLDDGLLMRDVSAADVLSLATARSPATAPIGGGAGGRAAGPSATRLAAIDEAAGTVMSPTMRAAAGLSSAAAATLVSPRLPVALVSPRGDGSPSGRSPEAADSASKQAPPARLQSYERQPSMRAMVVGSLRSPTLLGDAPGDSGAGGAASVTARPEGVERRSTFRRKPSLTRLIAPPGDHASTGARP